MDNICDESQHSGRAQRTMFDKIAICDPVCIQPFGHNLNAQTYYKEYLKKYCNNTICIGGSDLDEAVSRRHGILRIFPHVYNSDIPVLDWSNDPLFGSTDPRRDISRLLSYALERIFGECYITSRDALFFPSVDFWSIIALYDNRKLIAASGNPAIFLRFIGVMENAHRGCFSDPLNEIERCLKIMTAEGFDIRVSAETPAYAKHLSSLLGFEVITAPYPEAGDVLDTPVDPDEFWVACPGSARGDKGYFQLQEIFSSVRKQDPDQRIKFVLQRLPDRDNIHHLKYLAQLYAVPGVKLLPSTLDQSEIENIYKISSLILVPYEAHIYKLRGSAVTMEAIAYGRPLLALDGPAFAQQIADYGAGTVCEDLNGLVQTILAYAAMPPALVRDQCQQARENFFRDVHAAYDEWFQ